jgi:hypothetical protein
MFQSGCSDFIADFLHYRQPKNMRRGFSASLLKRRSVEAARLLDSPHNYELPLRGKLIKEGIELRGRQHHWISVKLPISGK